jgi:hypothetical protein
MLPSSTWRKKSGSALAICVAIAALTGCGSGARLEKQIADVKQELLRVQNDYDRLEERLGALETSQSRPTAAAPAQRPERPALKVVRMAPEDDDAPPAQEESPRLEPAPVAEGPRPMIKGSGDKVYATGNDAPVSKGTRAPAVTGEKR